MTSLVFDVETTGLFAKGASFKNLQALDKARMLSISWILAQNDMIVEQSYFIIRPDGWSVTQDSIKIHGITQEHAEENGVNVVTVLKNFITSVKRCKTVVAHNIDFDETIIKSELFRYGMKEELDTFQQKLKICTMKKGRSLMHVKKYPKLAELYRFLYNDDIQNAHDAYFDTLYCFKCFIKMFPFDRSIFYFGEKEIKLTEEQQNIVFEDLHKNMLIIAGAGSGKTMSIIARIKYMIDNGIKEDSIILTTFTRNAANDMRERLFDVMGYKTDIQVGTIDSIAKYYVENNCPEYNVERVDEYAPIFLNFLRKKQTFFKRFQYLLVDEVQDINQIQFDIINEFYKNGTYIIGIGDDCQNIYEFRGSNIQYIINFNKYFQNTVIHKLTHNFRSTKEIIDLANASIYFNINKIAKTMIAGEGMTNMKPNVKQFPNSQAQYMFVIEKVMLYVESGIPIDSICVMSPINKYLLEMHKIFNSHNIPNYYCSSSDDSKVVKLPGHLSLNTIHRSKGLEWDVVFLIGMNDDQNRNTCHFNSQNRRKCQQLLEANRRLFYVAVTRAKQYLYILSDRPDDITRFVTEVSCTLFE